MKRGLIMLAALWLAAWPDAAARAGDALAEADSLSKAGRYEEAVRVLEESLFEEQDVAEIYYRLGVINFHNLKRFEEAAIHFRRYLEIKQGPEAVRDWLMEAESAVLFSRLEKDLRKPGDPGNYLKPNRLTEAKTAEDRTQADDTQKQEKKEDETDLSVIAFRNLEGTVTGVSGKRVEIDMGTAGGVTWGMEFNVYRDGTWIGLLKVVEPAPDGSSCLPLAGRRKGPQSDESSPQEEWDFLPGDIVHQREDVLGAGLASGSKARSELLGWQREEQAFQKEYQEMLDSEQRLMRKLLQMETPGEVTRVAEDLRALQNVYARWEQRYVKWLDSLMAIQEERLTENPHVAAFREELSRELGLAEGETTWRTVSLELQLDLFTYVSRQSAALEKEQAELEKKSREFENRAKQLNTRIENFNEDVSNRSLNEVSRSNFNQFVMSLKRKQDSIERAIDGHESYRQSLIRDYDRYNDHVIAFNEGVSERLEIMTILKEDISKWRSSDGIYQIREKEEDRLANDIFLSLGWQQLLRGRYAPAAKHFRKILESAPDPRRLAEAQKGLDLALLKGVLEGIDASVEEKAPAAEMTLLWKSEVGNLEGPLRVDAGAVYGFFRHETETGERLTLSARDMDTGSVSWERDCPSGLDGPWIMENGIIVFASGGVLHRLEARNGDLLDRWKLDSGPGKLVRAEAVRADRQTVLWKVSFETPGGEVQDRLYHIDSGDTKKSWAVAPKGRIRDIWIDGSTIMANLRRGPDGSSKSPHKGITCLVEDFSPNLWKQGLTIGSGNMVQWGEFKGGLLILNVISRGEDEYLSTVCFMENNGKNWRVVLTSPSAVAGARHDDDRTYILQVDGSVTCIERDSRVVLWTTKGTGEGDDGQDAWFLDTEGNELVVLSGAPHAPWNLQIIDSEQGVATTDASMPGGDAGIPVYRDGMLLMAEKDGTLRKVDVSREETVWTTRLGGETLLLPALPDPDGIVTRDGVLVATGEDRSREISRKLRSAEEPGHGPGLVMTGDRVFFVNSQSNVLYALGEGEERP